MADLIRPASVADFLLDECRERGEVLTNLKLQKLLYYSQAWYLALNNKALFEEDFEAWVHGPVLPSQYYRFRGHQWRPIDDLIIHPGHISFDISSHLCEIVDVFGSESAVALELMTHQERPWIKARGGIARDEPSNSKISKDSMRDFYLGLANQED